MKKSLCVASTMLLVSNTATASSVEDLILLCRGGMDTKQIIQVSGEIEGKLLKLAKVNAEGNGSLNSSGTVSQYDLINSIKSGVSEALYKYDLKEYHLCIERMAPQVLSGKTEIAGKTIDILPSQHSGLIKTAIRTSNHDINMVFQYARQEGNEYIIAIRLKNNNSSNDRTFVLKKGSAKLVGEDSGENYKLLSITGINTSSDSSVDISPLGTQLVKFRFELPEQVESLTFSSSWPTAGSSRYLGVTTTFTPKPLNITWLNVKAMNYEFSGTPEQQKL